MLLSIGRWIIDVLDVCSVFHFVLSMLLGYRLYMFARSKYFGTLGKRLMQATLSPCSHSVGHDLISSSVTGGNGNCRSVRHALESRETFERLLLQRLSCTYSSGPHWCARSPRS